MIPTHEAIKLKRRRKAAREERTYAASLTSLKTLSQVKVREMIGDKRGPRSSKSIEGAEGDAAPMHGREARKHRKRNPHTPAKPGREPVLDMLV